MKQINHCIPYLLRIVVGICVLGALWTMTLLSTWIILNWRSVDPPKMSLHDKLVEFVATVFDAAYGLWVPHVLTLALLVWVVTPLFRHFVTRRQ